MEQRRSIVPDLKPSINGLELLNLIRNHPPFGTGHHRIDLELWNRPLKRRQSSSSSTATKKVSSDSIELIRPKNAGLSRGQHLQVEGPPGIGKTKFALGVAIRSRTLSLSKNDERFDDSVEVLFIDTEGSVNYSCIERSVRVLIESELKEFRLKRSDLIEKVLAGIYLVRITSSSELGFFFRRLPKWLETHNKVKLIVLDSITAHTRYVSMSISDRSIIASIIRDGLTVASSFHDCAVIVTSQLTSRLTKDEGVIMIPPDFQSNAWSSSPKFSFRRLILGFNQDGSRKAVVIFDNYKPILQNQQKQQLEKSPSMAFGINIIGIYDPKSSEFNFKNMKKY